MAETSNNDNARWLTVNGSLLDFELQQIWSLQIEVSDGLSKDIYTLIVKVEDISDNPPAWQNIPSVHDITDGMLKVNL